MMDEKDKTIYQIEPIGYIHTDFPEKFGIPRQSGLSEHFTGTVTMCAPFRTMEAFRELEGFSHIWLLWIFSDTGDRNWHATVRPPRLGGNRRGGVFAARSPCRPNRLGISCVRLLRIRETENGPELDVSGVDMKDGTPIVDIKPYIPYTDIRTDASSGYARDTADHKLEVDFPEELFRRIPENLRDGLMEVLHADPRPGYSEETGRKFGVSYGNVDVGFTVANGVLHVSRVSQRMRNDSEKDSCGRCSESPLYDIIGKKEKGEICMTEQQLDMGKTVEQTAGRLMHEEIEGCVAVCPLCGSDLSYQDYSCVCKNDKCDFFCDKCKSEDEP